MQARSLFCTMLLVLAAFAGNSLHAADKAAIDAKIKQASEYLSKPEQNEGGVRGLKLLAEAIALAGPETGFPPEFTEKISTAGDKFLPGASSLEEGIGLLRESYRVIHAGKDFQMPPSISSMEHAKGYIRKHIEEARSCLAQGKTAESTMSLLEVALVIVTPVIQ